MTQDMRTRSASVLKTHTPLWALVSALGLAVLTLVPQVLQAGVIAYDPFNQGVGNIANTASSGGSPVAVWPSGDKWGNVQNIAQIASGTLSYGPLVSQGNHALVTSTGPSTSTAFRPLDKKYGEPGSSLWLSFLMQGTVGNVNEGLALFSDSSEKMYIGHTSQGGSSYAIWDKSQANPVAVTTPVDAKTHFFAVNLQMTVSGSTYTLYVDPDFSSLGSRLTPVGAATAIITTNTSLQFNRIRIGEFNGTTALFDEFRMGTTWADVSTAAVPEPSGLALGFLLMGLSTVVGWRRRNRAT